MNRTLLLLNALALAVLVGLILQPEGAMQSSRTQASPAITPHLTTFESATRSMPASIQPFASHPTAERLAF